MHDLHLDISAVNFFRILLAATMASLINAVSKNFDNVAKLMDCVKYLLNSEFNSDIQFHFKSTSVKLYGHKFIIGLRSSVFNTMFYGSFAAGNGNVCKIEDISPTSFYELLKFIYTDEVNISEKNWSEIMYAAHKYSINYLEKLCCNYVKQKLNADNCCSYLQQCFLYDNDLSKKCLEIIDQDIRFIIEKNTWKDLNDDQMMAILRRDSLDIGEYTLFDGLMAWAKNACESQGIDMKKVNMREKFPMFELVRFPIMTLGEFSQFHRNNKYFLRSEEIADLFQYINAGIMPFSLSHSTVKRRPKMRTSKVKGRVSKRISYPHTEELVTFETQ